MIRKYIYAGIVLLIIAVIAFYSVLSFVPTSIPNVANITVLSNSIGYVPVLVNASDVTIIFVFASGDTNIYYLNQSAFDGLSGYLAGNASGSGYTYVLAHNVNKSDIFQGNITAVNEEYQTPAISGNYYVYAVVDSTNGSPSANSVVSASIVYTAYSNSSWTTMENEWIERILAGVSTLILGFALLIYGAFKKPKVAAQNEAAKKKR